jgi:small subunit ribosomal protein S3Ae
MKMVKPLMKGKLKKRWFYLVAPNVFGNQSLGETPTYAPESLVGRYVTVNLMNLTRDMRMQNINVSFVVTRVAGDKAYTNFVGYKIIPSSIKRLIRRTANKLDYAFKTITADNKKVIIKILLVTRVLSKRSVTTSLIKTAEEFLTSALKKMRYDEVVSELVSYKMQSSLKKYLHKITPLKTCEIRQMKLIVKESPEFSVVEEIPVEKKEVKAEEIKEEKTAEAAEAKETEEVPKEVKEAAEVKEEKPKKRGRPKKEVKEERIEEVKAEE